MTEKRFYCDDPAEYRSYGIFDLSKTDKTMDDFRDEDGLLELWRFRLYLAEETDSILTGEEVTERLNQLTKENEQLLDFKNKTLNLINEKIKKGEEAIEWGGSKGADVGAMQFHIALLKRLKKELFE